MCIKPLPFPYLRKDVTFHSVNTLTAVTMGYIPVAVLMMRVAKGGGGGVVPITHHAVFFLLNHASQRDFLTNHASHKN